MKIKDEALIWRANVYGEARSSDPFFRTKVSPYNVNVFSSTIFLSGFFFFFAIRVCIRQCGKCFGILRGLVFAATSYLRSYPSTTAHAILNNFVPHCGTTNFTTYYYYAMPRSIYGLPIVIRFFSPAANPPTYLVCICGF